MRPWLIPASIPLLWLGACSEPPPPPPPKDATPPPQQEDYAEPPPTEAPNQLPRLKQLTYTPTRPNAFQDVVASAQTIDPDGDRVRVSYAWLKNDKLQLHQGSASFPQGETAKGDVLMARVTLDDGTDQVVVDGPPITIQNSAPTFVSDPRITGRVDGVRLQAEDRDGDALTYKLSGGPPGMSINQAGILSYSGSEEAKAGKYKVTITVDDGDEGTAKWSFELAVSGGSAAKKAQEKADATAKEEAG